MEADLPNLLDDIHLVLEKPLHYLPPVAHYRASVVPSLAYTDCSPHGGLRGRATSNSEIRVWPQPEVEQHCCIDKYRWRYVVISIILLGIRCVA